MPKSSKNHQFICLSQPPEHPKSSSHPWNPLIESWMATPPLRRRWAPHWSNSPGTSHLWQIGFIKLKISSWELGDLLLTNVSPERKHLLKKVHPPSQMSSRYLLLQKHPWQHCQGEAGHLPFKTCKAYGLDFYRWYSLSRSSSSRSSSWSSSSSSS